jgi:hypothetical protein
VHRVHHQRPVEFGGEECARHEAEGKEKESQPPPTAPQWAWKETTPVVTAYNDATAGLKYSGFNYIKHKKVRLNTGNNETLDFIDTDDSDHQLRAHEIVTHRRSYANDLPVTCYTAADAFTTQFLYMTEIQFDDIVIENSHAEVVNQMNPNFEDYQITLAPGTSASFTSANIVVLAVHYDRYLWDEKRGMQLSKMIDLNAQ